MRRFVDLAKTDDEKLDAVMPLPLPDIPDYPYGCRVCLCEDEIRKLEEAGVDVDFQVGEVIDLRGLGTVTSVSDSDGPGGHQRRVEIQIEKLVVESEDDEEMGGDDID